MTFIAGILTFFLVINCAVLILLILVQLPKKDAGAGLAFGGGAADALFGAGSGNALTKITKWATVAFILVAIILGAVQSKLSHGNQSEIEQEIEQQQQMQQSAPAMPVSQPSTPTTPQTTPQSATTPAASPSILPLSSMTNAPAGGK